MAVPTGFKYAALFKKHLSFNPDTPVIRYDIEELMQFFGDCLEMFKAEPTLLKVPIPVHVVGDIHGQYEDLHRIFGAVLSKSSSARFLFLGDLVDRGAASLQCLVAVLVRKMAHPNKYYLVRGNHEALSINVSYGFFDELKNRFEVQTARELMKKIGRMYAWIPLAAIINKKIFCVHGGIGPNISCLDDFDNVQRPLKSTSGNNFAQDILWSDPKADLMGTAPNTNRTTSIFYGPDEAERVCGVLGVDCIIRAHQVVQKGYDFPFHNKKVITLFSAPGYQTEPFTNDGAIAIVKNNEQTDRMEIKFQRFEPIQNAFGSTFKNMADDLTILESTDESMLKSEEDLDPKKAKTPEKPKEGVVCQDCQAKEAEKESKEFEKPKEEPKPKDAKPEESKEPRLSQFKLLEMKVLELKHAEFGKPKEAKEADKDAKEKPERIKEASEKTQAEAWKTDIKEKPKEARERSKEPRERTEKTCETRSGMGAPRSGTAPPSSQANSGQKSVQSAVSPSSKKVRKPSVLDKIRTSRTKSAIKVKSTLKEKKN